MTNGEIEQRLWRAADRFRADADLKPSEYSRPVLGLLFLRFAERMFAEAEEKIGPIGAGTRRKVSKADYEAEGIIFLTPEARFPYLLNLTEGDDIGKAINEAMKAVEDNNPSLVDALPKAYTRIDSSLLFELLRLLSPLELDGDMFGRVYEYFMGNFAMMEMQKGGEFFTPASIVQLIVEIIEPYHGRILDPACGSGGMFVHSANFVTRQDQSPSNELSIYGMEKLTDNMRLAVLNLAVHGLTGDVRVANTYYDRPRDLFPEVYRDGGFDFVMANPPFNVSGVDKERLEGDERFPFGLPTPDNANYIWIQQFYAALNANGRAGFVMANSAGDARGSEQLIRQQLIKSGAVDVIVSVGSNFFYTVTLPCTLWFLDRRKTDSDRNDKVLFLDARHIYHQVDRAHRDFTPQQIEFLANIVRLYRGEEPELANGSDELLAAHGLGDVYVDVAGLCKVVTRLEIETQGWSLNPGRYVGAAECEEDGVDFTERLVELSEELEVLNAEALSLEEQIAQQVTLVIESV